MILGEAIENTNTLFLSLIFSYISKSLNGGL